jgi:mannan endo-1,4-beta-mannosidase
VADHIAGARRLGKPSVLEEYGVQVDPARGVADQAARIAAYRRWTDIVQRRQGDGDQFWILTSLQDDGTLYPDFDGFRVVTPSPMATMLTAHARRMARLPA